MFIKNSLTLINSGISCIPIQKKTKLPALSSWREYQQRLPTEQEITKWACQDVGLALITGNVSGIWAIDIDNEGAAKWAKKTFNGTKTIRNKTKKGYHLFFKIPSGEKIKNSVGKVHDGVDIRGEGGYVLIEPSIHPSGHIYKLEYDDGIYSFDDIPKMSMNDIVTFNFKWNKKVSVTSEVQKGSRNDTLARLAGNWVKNNAYEEALLIAYAYNDRMLKPSLPDKEVERTIKSIYTREYEVTETSTEIKKEITFPKECLSPDGILSEIMEFINDASPVSHSIFDLGAAISTLGTVSGHRFKTRTGLRTNFYNVCLGDSSSGKNAGYSAIPKLLRATKAKNMVSGQDVTSAAAIIKWLAKEGHEVGIYLFDEMGLYLEAAKHPTSFKSELPKFLMSAFSNVGGAYSKVTTEDEKIFVPWHHISVYGCSTPITFWRSFTSSEAIDGFLARLMVFESNHDPKRPKRRIYSSPQLILINKINEIFESLRMENKRPVPQAIEIIIPEVEDIYLTKRKELKGTHDGRLSIYGRTVEHISKLALLHHVSIYGASAAKHKIEQPSIRWAHSLGAYLSDHLIDSIRDNISDSPFHSLCNRMTDIIKKRSGTTIRQLIQALHMTRKNIQEIVDTLCESGTIVKRKTKPKRGPSCDKYYYFKNLQEDHYK